MRDATRLPSESSTTGTGDALDELERDHRLVEQLFARAALVEGGPRRALLGKIAEELRAHTALEEGIIYPAIAETVGGGDQLVARHRAEHDQVDALVGELAKATEDEIELVASMRQLQLAVQAHVAVEEAELFPAYRSKASSKALTDLTRAAAKSRRAPRR